MWQHEPQMQSRLTRFEIVALIVCVVLGVAGAIKYFE